MSHVQHCTHPMTLQATHSVRSSRMVGRGQILVTEHCVRYNVRSHPNTYQRNSMNTSYLACACSINTCKQSIRGCPSVVDMVRSTLLQVTSFRNQGVFRQHGERPHFTKCPVVKSYPNEELSTSTVMIFDVHFNCVHLRF